MVLVITLDTLEQHVYINIIVNYRNNNLITSIQYIGERVKIICYPPF